MANILRVDASARVTRSLTRALADRYLSAFANTHAQIVTRDVGTQPLPMVTEDWIAAAFTPDAERTAEQSRALVQSDQLIAEVDAADIIVISTPLYNYGMPAALKAWVDQIIRVGKTFSFDLARGDTPIEPILSGKTLVVLTASGEFGFDPGGVRAQQDHLIPHIRTVSKYLGAAEMEVVRIEYQEFGDDRFERSKAKALAEAEMLGKAHAMRLERP